MAVVQDFVSCTITLQTSAIPAASYDQMFLSDSTDVPVDLRYRSTTRSAFASDLTSTENTYKFANAFWSQKRTAQTLVLGRWVSAATTPYYVCGNYESDYTVWALVTDGSFKVTDGTNTDAVTGINFSTATSFANVITILNAALAGLGAPTITDLDSATFSLDIQSRLILTHNAATPGSSAPTLTIISDTTGTDLSTSTYFDAGTDGSSGITVSGFDIEEPTAAVTAIRAKSGGDAWYDMCIRGESTAQQQALATQFESLRKQLTLVSAEAGAKNAGSTSDVPYLLNALGYDRTMIMYTEHTITDTGGWVDAAIQGAVLPAEQGTTAWHKEVLTGVFESGLSGGSPIPLTATEVAALQGKECNYFVSIGNDTWMEEGHTVGGNEKHIVLGSDWISNSIETEFLTYKLNQPFAAFDTKTLVALEKVIRKYLNEAGPRGRNFLLDTRAFPNTITMPTADSFDSADRASHVMTLSNVFSAYANSTANRTVITGEIRI